ncbi:hypothetical protein [Nocardioides sp.]|uniref:hypothetical protein n=1 Tax=Nocardioides sp. TaxID=35761 RepID=UPI002C1D0C20|nr:hypothetical protein [Nocardioides sp.]HXH79514.1 hypothetical protein [Nocardioides sp.]
MAETVQITLTAKDGTTQTFRTAGAAAQKMGDQVEDAGKRGSKGLKDWADAGRATGLALGALGALAIKAANESEAVQSRLKQSIENTGESYDDLADRIDKMAETSLDLAFDDEDAASALASLTDATGSATKALDDMGLVMDIARARGISLADSARIVAAVEQERYGSLARLGIQIDENATREEALGVIQAKYAGQAEAYATTNAAAYEKFGNTVENTLESVGARLVDLQGPLIALGAGSQLLGPLASGLKQVGTAAKTAQIGAAALSLATGPVGLVAAAVAGGAAIYALTQRESEAEGQARRLAEATRDYTASIVDNTTALVNAGLYDAAKGTEAYLAVLEENGGIAADRIADVEAALRNLKSMNAELTGAPLDAIFDGVEVEKYTKNVVAAADANRDGLITAQELAAAQSELARGFVLSSGEAATLKTQVAGLTDELLDPELAGSEIQAEITRILTSLEAGTITFAQASTALQALEDDTTAYNIALRAQATEARSSAQAVSLMTGALDSQVVVVEATTSAYTQNATAIAGVKQERRGLAQDDYWEAERKAIEEATAASTAFGQGQANRGANAQTPTDPSALALPGIREYIAEQNALGQEVIATAEAHQVQAQAVLAATQSYAGMIGTTNALDAGISVVIGGLDRLGSGTDKVADSLLELVAAPGEWGELDELLARGRITLEEYSAALNASSTASEVAGGAQEEMNVILAKQAPLLASLADDQEAYLESIARMPAEQQLLALAYMDSAESAKALELQTLALSAANGEMGEGGKGFAKDIIRGAAEADPILKAMLVDMGLITVGAEGTIKVNFGEGTSELDALNTTLQQLQGSFEVALNLDINDDGIIGYVPPEKEMKVKPVVEEGADAPTFDPITWPVDLKINENAPPQFDPITVPVEPEWPQFDPVQIAPPPVKVTYEYETFDPPDLKNYTATIDVEAATANEKIGETERLLATIDTTTASASVSLDTGLFDTAYSTVTANVATLDALTASVSVSISSAVAGKVQEIIDDVATLDALTASVSISATSGVGMIVGSITEDMAALDALTASVSVSVSSAVAGKVQDITTDVETLDGLAASVNIGASDLDYVTVRNAVGTDVLTVDGWNPDVDIGGDTSQLEGAIGLVRASVESIDGWNPTINFGGETSQLEGVIALVRASAESIDGWNPTVDIGGNGQPFWDAMNNVQVSKDQVDGWNPIISIGGDGQPFWDAMNNVQVSKDQVDGWNPIVDIGADTSLYYGAVGGVSSSVAAVDGWSATVDIGANTAPYYANLPVTGQTIGTNYINVEQRRLGGQGGAFAVGGVVTARMGEVGPESVTIPGSGMRAIAPRDGLYTVPEGSYVSSAVATRGQGGGGGGMNFTGATIYVVASTPDIHDALNGQLLAQGRR